MSWGVTTASSHSHSLCTPPPRTPSPGIHPHRRCSVIPSVSPHPSLSFSSVLSSGSQRFPRINFRCNSTGGSGDNESRTILDAFFLGKAVAEALNERVESAVGEFLSTVGRLQAEQQKQVQEFQEEVLEKARRAKEQAAREAMETQGLVSNPTTTDITKVNGLSSTGSGINGGSSAVSKPINDDPLSGMMSDD